MKYTIPLFALALTAVADPTRTVKKASLVQRDLATVTSILANINDLTGKLDTIVKGFSASSSDQLQAASDEILSAITAGVTTVQGSEQLSLTDALGVQAPVNTLTETVKSVVADLKAQKQAIVAAGQGGAVLKSLTDQKAASTQLANAITSKLPQDVQALAATLSAGISDALQEGITAYQDQAGSSSGGSSGGSGSSGSGSSGSGSSGSGSSGSGSSGSGSSGSGSSGSGSAGTAPKPSASKPATPSPSKSAPAQFTGAGAVNSVSGLGALAVVAAVLAL